MRVSFRKIAARLTGIATPIFGISWTPPESDREIVRKLLTFLEDRRVLYNPYSLEVMSDVIRSIIRIRNELTSILQTRDEESDVSGHLRSMRAACRKFLNSVEGDTEIDERRRRFQLQCPSSYFYLPPQFAVELGEMRSTFGVHLAQLCVKYGFNLEEDLAAILPLEDEQSKAEKSGAGPFLRAVIDDDITAAKASLAKGTDVNTAFQYGMTALMHAAQNGHTDMARLLLEAGADVDGQDSASNSSLIHAARSGHTDIVRLLLDHGADVNAANGDGKSALMFAAWMGHAATLNILLDHGAEINARDNSGYTALILATAQSQGHIVRILLDSGEDVTAKDYLGQTALMYAEGWSPAIAAMIREHRNREG